MRIIVPLDARACFEAAFCDEFAIRIGDDPGFETSVHGFGVCYETDSDSVAIAYFCKGFLKAWESVK